MTDNTSSQEAQPVPQQVGSKYHIIIFVILIIGKQPSGASPIPQLPSAPPSLRPAVGGRPGGARTPRLGLAIPPSPNAKPIGNANSNGPQPVGSSRPALPSLHLATPMGTQSVPQEQPSRSLGAQPVQSAGGGSESSAAHSRSGSFGPLDGRASNPTSAGSQYSALSFASQYGIGVPKQHGTPDPVSAVGSMYSERSEGGVAMERDGSLQGLEAFDQLSIDKARTADVEELDDEGWRIASVEGRIEELGNLGEGAGGAVTKAKLKGGKTVFALKVGNFSFAVGPFKADKSRRSSLPIRTLMSRDKSSESWGSTRNALRNTFVNTTVLSLIPPLPPSPSPWSSVREALLTASIRK